MSARQFLPADTSNRDGGPEDKITDEEGNTQIRPSYCSQFPPYSYFWYTSGCDPQIFTEVGTSGTAYGGRFLRFPPSRYRDKSPIRYSMYKS